MKRATFLLRKRKSSVRYRKFNSIVYDKLSSTDVFDFDNYLHQFEGKIREFMEKFVKTQMFNNFIEDTYKTTSHQTMIGFFKTNFEVMLDHSFKKLKKE